MQPSKLASPRAINLGEAGTWKPVARISGATWTAVLPAIPAGGPYKVELRTQRADPIIIKDVLIRDLWVLARQSNMEGLGQLERLKSLDPRVRDFDMLDRWTLTTEPLHNLRGAVDPVDWLGNPPPSRGGTALPFAVEMVKRTVIPIGLIPCAPGGSSMAQWNPDLKGRAVNPYAVPCCGKFRPVVARLRACVGIRRVGRDSERCSRVLEHFE